MLYNDEEISVNLSDFYSARSIIDSLKLSKEHKKLLKLIVENNLHKIKDKSLLNFYSNDKIYQSYIMDLISWGLIGVRNNAFDNFSYDDYIATHYGLSVVSYLNKVSKKTNSAHNQLIYDFSINLENQGLFSFDDIEIKTSYGLTRPDIFSINKTLNDKNLNPTCYEIKHSRADFLSDMKKENKWRSYLEVCDKLFYVCPAGLIKKEELPKECGLIYQLESGEYQKIKNAKKRNTELSISLLMKLLLRMEQNKNVVMITPK